MTSRKLLRLQTDVHNGERVLFPTLLAYICVFVTVEQASFQGNKQHTACELQVHIKRSFEYCRASMIPSTRLN